MATKDDYQCKIPVSCVVMVATPERSAIVEAEKTFTNQTTSSGFSFPLKQDSELQLVTPLLAGPPKIPPVTSEQQVYVFKHHSTN